MLSNAMVRSPADETLEHVPNTLTTAPRLGAGTFLQRAVDLSIQPLKRNECRTQ